MMRIISKLFRDTLNLQIIITLFILSSCASPRTVWHSNNEHSTPQDLSNAEYLCLKESEQILASYYIADSLKLAVANPETVAFLSGRQMADNVIQNSKKDKIFKACMNAQGFYLYRIEE